MVEAAFGAFGPTRPAAVASLGDWATDVPAISGHDYRSMVQHFVSPHSAARSFGLQDFR